MLLTRFLACFLHGSENDRPTMIRINENDETFILSTALARKRVRVVQLLVVGLVGLLIGFLGGLYIQSSCHFYSGAVEVGQNAQVFSLHYGLWKYTPMDSVFQGYSYCFEYDTKYTNDAPMIPRWVSCVALVLGSYSLSVLWFYLIFGRARQFFWHVAVFAAAVAGILQLCTLLVFTGEVCLRDDDVCTLGPAGILSVVASMVWFILAFELHYNSPMSAWVTEIKCTSEDEPPVSGLEMTDFEDASKAYVRRIVQGESEDAVLPTLNQIQRQNTNPIGEYMLELEKNPTGSYKPPVIV